MGAIGRWLIWILGTLAVLMLAAAGALYFLLSRLDVRSEIEQAVEQATGRQLTIAGNVGVSFWPLLGLRAEQASLANVAGGRAPALAAIDVVSVGVELRPLLDREVVVNEVVLEHPRIALEIDAQGRPNWVLRAAQPAAAARPGQSVRRRTPITLRDLHIRDGEMSYFDARRNGGYQVSAINLNMRLTTLDAPAHVDGDVNYGGQGVHLEGEIASPRAAIRGQPTNITATLSSDLLQAGYAGQITSGGVLTGNVNAQGPSLRRMTAWLVAPIPDGYGLADFEAHGQISTANREISFTNSAVALDAIRGRGDFRLSQLRGRPYVSGVLQLEGLDLNPYLAAASATPQSSDATIAQAAQAPQRVVDVATAPQADRPMDFSSLRTINSDLELVTASLRVQRMRIDRTRLTLVINDGFLAATMHEFAMYGGTGHGRVEIDARTADTRLHHELVGDHIDARGFLTDAAGFSNIEGPAEINMNLTTQGRTQMALLRAMDGRIQFELAGGTLHGVDLGGVATTLRRALNNTLIQPTASTRLTGMSATFSVSDGVMGSESLSFNTPNLRLRGLGVIDLPGRSLDMYLAPQGSILAIPFRTNGPWTTLHFAASGPNGRTAILTRVRAIQAGARGTAPAAAASAR